MKRANGTGSIVNLGPNRRRRYAVRVSYVDREGLWKQRYLSYHRTAKEAQEALDLYLQKEAHTSSSLAVTWSDIYEQWSARKYPKAGKNSIATYKASWKRLSVLSGKPMTMVTVDDLQRIIDQDEQDSLSQSSIEKDLVLMRALFKYAMERDIVSKDCSVFVELPTVGPKYAKGAFTEDQIADLSSLASSGFPWADTVLMLCYTGFRISEFLTLAAEDYHEENDIAYLRGGSKTEAGRNRIVPIHPKIKPYLLNRLKQNGDRIICHEDGRKIRPEYYRGSCFAPIVKQLGAPSATPHWCRHTAASRMKSAHLDDLAIRRILGHSDKSITDHYTHVDVAFLAQEILKLP